MYWSFLGRCDGVCCIWRRKFENGGLMFTEDALLELTRLKLPGGAAADSLEEIVKGGSDRRFYRVRLADEGKGSVILMTYTLARPDNPRFVPATRRLRGLGVNVPEVYAHDEKNLMVWLEDLGTVDLHAFRGEPWEVRVPLYRATLAEVAKLHAVVVGGLSAQDMADMEPGFDESLYHWEQDYFLAHFMKGLRGVEEVPGEVEKVLKQLREELAVLPRGLVHRDFQSQNVIMRDGGAWLIDYQGVRPGLPAYDLASLLLDPYVEMAEVERLSLLRWYAEHRRLDFDELMGVYWRCAAQRLMQALGAYANLSRNLGKPHFEAHVPVAVARLKGVCTQLPALEPLGRWVG
jgi:aminoglycoside/choline kinase family phosphotransferase